MTVYSHFHDKETLFETIVSATSDQMIGALSAPDCSERSARTADRCRLAFLG